MTPGGVGTVAALQRTFVHALAGDPQTRVIAVYVEAVGNGAAFIDALLPHLIKPEFSYRHKWKPGDLVLWDNRSLLHLAYRDYDPGQGRIMHRVLLQGEVPV